MRNHSFMLLVQVCIWALGPASTNLTALLYLFLLSLLYLPHPRPSLPQPPSRTPPQPCSAHPFAHLQPSNSRGLNIKVTHTFAPVTHKHPTSEVAYQLRASAADGTLLGRQPAGKVTYTCTPALLFLMTLLCGLSDETRMHTCHPQALNIRAGVPT